MQLEEIVHYRRSIRYYKDEPINTEKVRKCIELATLAPNSSNMQLWEFYHITSAPVLEKLAKACLGQNAACTAKELVAIVVRKDLWAARAKANIEALKMEYGEKSKSEYSKREQQRLMYYGKLMPFLYNNYLGVFGSVRKIATSIIGVFKPIYRQTSNADMRVVAHKSAALAAQTFMLAMAEHKYDTCPMEGFDSALVKRALNLPYGAEVNMIISCGIRNEEKGIYGNRFRIPFEQVYKRI